MSACTTPFGFIGEIVWSASNFSESLTAGMRASQRIGSLYRSRRFLTPEACLHLYKSTIRPIMEHCCLLWSGAPKSHLSLLDRVQHRMEKLVGSALYSTLEPTAAMLLL